MNVVNGSGKSNGFSDNSAKSSEYTDNEIPIVVRNEIIGISHSLSPITERTEHSDNSFSTSELSNGSRAQVSSAENSNDSTNLENVPLGCSEISNRSIKMNNEERSAEKDIDPEEFEQTDANCKLKSNCFSLQYHNLLEIATPVWEENSNGAIESDESLDKALVPLEDASTESSDESLAGEKELETAASHQQSSSVVENYIKEGKWL